MKPGLPKRCVPCPSSALAELASVNAETATPIPMVQLDRRIRARGRTSRAIRAPARQRAACSDRAQVLLVHGCLAVIASQPPFVPSPPQPLARRGPLALDGIFWRRAARLGASR